MRLLILGAGAVGSVIADNLSRREEFDEIVVADRRKTAPKALAKRLGSDKVTPMTMNANNVDEMKAGMKEVDLVINAVLPRYFLKIMQAALESGTNYMDMATDLGVAAHERAGDPITKIPIDLQLEQDQKWKDAGLAALLCWGNDPGAVNVYARYAADQMDEVEKILIRDGDNAVIEGYDGFVALWSPDTLIEEVATMDALVWTDGRFERVPSLSRSDEFEFPPPVGRMKVWTVDHEEPETLGRQFADKGCRECNFMLALPDDMVETLRVLRRLGLTRPKPIEINGVKVHPRDVVTALMPSPTDPEILKRLKGYACIGAQVIGSANGKRISHFIYQTASYEEIRERWNATVTAWQTATPPAAVATMLARGQITRKGAYTPEVLDPKPILDTFNEFGFTWSEIKREIPLSGNQ